MKTFADKHYCVWCGGKLKNINSNTKECSACQAPEHKIVISAAGIIVINDQGQVLVGTRGKDPNKGMYDLPGGFSDPDETAEQVATRELLEETGLKVSPEEVVYAGTTGHSYFYKGRDEKVLDVFYAVHLKTTPEVEAKDDVSKLEWVAPKDINFSEFWNEGVADVLKSYLHKQNML